MKNIITILLLCLLGGFTHAQKMVEKHLGHSTGKPIKMNIQIADSIRIITWNKSEVYAKASIDINDNKDNDVYITSFEETDGNINIRAKFDDDKAHRVYRYNDSCHCTCNNYMSKIYWDVYVPENSEFSVETIDGNIIIEGNTDQVRAHTISGFIDMAFASSRKSDLKMSTISGTIYTNVALDKSKGRRGGNSVHAEYNGGGKPVDLETISGNIFLRKAGQ